MEAIISRPKVDAKQSPARKQAANPKIRPLAEGDRIAIEAATSIQAMCMYAIYTDDEADSKISYESQVLLGGAKTITQYIGAAADDALGGDISGDFEYWTYGPHFANAGKGGAA